MICLDRETTLLAGKNKQQYNPLPVSIYHFFWKMMDWIYPPVCPGCNTLGFRFCENCFSEISFIQSPICKKCGQPILTTQHDFCKSCSDHMPSFSQLRSVTIYDGAIRNAILKMKFHRDFGISEFLGQLLVDLYIKLNWNIDLIIPVPLSSERQKTRGFNQSYRLALPISLYTKIPIDTKALYRTINTQTQSDLPKNERFKNVKNAFESNANLIQNKNILIIDDVATTSSTINACSIALLKNGAKSVFGITVARAVL